MKRTGRTFKAKRSLKSSVKDRKSADALEKLMARVRDPEFIEMAALEKDYVRWNAYVVARNIERFDYDVAATLIRNTPRDARFGHELCVALTRKPGLLLTTVQLRIVSAWLAAFFRVAMTPDGFYNPLAEPTYLQVKEQYKKLFGTSERMKLVALNRHDTEEEEEGPTEQYFRKTLKQFGLPLRRQPVGPKKKEAKN
jgi:hypothetical protein